MPRARFLLRQLHYDLSTSMWLIPSALVVALAALGFLTRYATGAHLGLGFLFDGEPGAAQLVLSTIASATMTVVSVVYSILLVALSLASMQFSTRILHEVVRDRVSQMTLGIFVGTFVYCLLVLRLVRVGPPPVVPEVGVVFAIVLSLAAMGQLLLFLHHITQLIQANHLVARVADNAAAVIDRVFSIHAERPPEPVPTGGVEIESDAAGYVQGIDHDALVEVATRCRGRVVVEAGVGRFASQGVTLVRVVGELSPEAEVVDLVRAAFDLGPVRIAQDDVEWGVRQIVDVALKAVSPAVNDPSTACTCVDHLTRLLVHAARRPQPGSDVRDRHGVVRVQAPGVDLAVLIDLAVSQLRQYVRTDMAVTLRLLRLLSTVAGEPLSLRARERVRVHARLLLTQARAAFAPEDVVEAEARHARVERALGRVGSS